MKLRHDAIDIQKFDAICAQQTALADYPNASAVESNLLLYQARTLRAALEQPKRLQLQQELVKAFTTGPGVVIIKGFYPDLAVIDEHNQLLDALFSLESDRQAADHFAKAGANGRIWNSLQKAALHSPRAFINYYKNPLFSLIAEAWLGPHYQMTAQVNVVRPGGQAQSPHRDYHLGFQDKAVLGDYPPHVHQLSPQLTLQGGVAHTEMPIESGPTLYLPFSQQYEEGYLAWRDEAFKEYFADNFVQIAIEKGDAIFFNPALFHAAGSNHTADFHRIANLFQLSSAFGRAMESVDREAMCLAIYSELLEQTTSLSSQELAAILNNTAEGYSFPTNLDTDPPLAGMAPKTQKQLMRLALKEQWSLADFRKQLQMHSKRRLA